MARSYSIAVIPGDGTGPEVVAEGIKVLKAVAAVEGISLDFTTFDFGGDRYLRTGEILPENRRRRAEEIPCHLPGRHRPFQT
jgi:3-isopropylmalate dehydrogenase